MVRDCTSRTEELYNVGHREGPPIEFGVCSFHFQALNEGETWTVNGAYTELILGTQGPLQLINFQVTFRVGKPVVTLELGHDEIVSDTIEVQMEPDKIRRLCHWAGDGKHVEDFNR